MSAFAGPVLIIRGGSDAFVTEQLVDAISPRFTAVVDVEVITTVATGCISSTPTRSRR